MHGLLVTLKNLFVRTEDDNITCMGGFIDQPTQGYNGNMPSRWVRIVGVRDTGLGPA